LVGPVKMTSMLWPFH